MLGVQHNIPQWKGYLMRQLAASLSVRESKSLDSSDDSSTAGGDALWLRHSLPHSFITSACDISLTVHDLSIANCFLTRLLCSFTNRAKSDGLRATFGVWLLPIAMSPLLPGTSISISLPLHLPQQCFAGSTLRLWRFITTLQFKAVHACYYSDREIPV